jgi:hypothetical protein
MIERKYRIHEMLQTLSIKQYRAAKEYLPVELGISAQTFNNYLTMGVAAPQDIPYTIVAKLEIFFGLQPGQLKNFDIDFRPATSRDAPEAESITTKHHLVKA